MRRVEVLLGAVQVRGALAQAVGAVDVLLLGRQGEQRARARVDDGLAARRWRRGGDRRRLELDVQERRLGRVGGGEVQKGVGERRGGRGGGRGRGWGRAQLARKLGRELRGRLLLGVTCRDTNKVNILVTIIS